MNTVRSWLFLWLAALILATVLRYCASGRWLFTFTSGHITKGVPFNIVGFWLVIGTAALITLLKLGARFTHKM